MSILQEGRVCLRNIASQNARLRALISLRDEETVVSELQALDNNSSGDGSRKQPLRGKTVVLKDNICTTWGTTTCASRMLENYKSPYNATIVDQIAAAKAVFLGKANMDEFAMGTDNIHTIYGPPLNPLFPSEAHTTGGSSGGSAAAVAAHMCDIAIGTDTGGSVRLPAAYCGVVGFKPSYGLISRWGVVAFAQSLDTVGIVARDVGAVRTMFHVLNAFDEKDPTSISPALRARLRQRADSLTSPSSSSKFRIGIPSEFNVDSLSPVVKEAWKRTLANLRAAGHELYSVSLPSTVNALPTYYIIAPAEAASNLARYDGVRFGFRSEVDYDTSDPAAAADGVLYGRTRSEGFGTEVRRRILLGNYNLSAGAIVNHYIQAQRVRRLTQLDFDRIFTLDNPLAPSSSSSSDSDVTVDFLVSPCSTDTAPTLDDVLTQKSPLDAYVNDVLTVPASLAGIPAISVPVSAEGGERTVGIQVMGQYGDDERVLGIAEEIMKL
ncbi:glutamyl-tRNA amidotransferase subunit A [Myxozyma melibiosi]|uniref:Glutamyl-tRNA(Gln) amidotransferase subunit A, mitochondrial n=1 Tax=Myxozyma melibiosi TaxID=54550 RepID=A0ABR1F6A5_9ASCO